MSKRKPDYRVRVLDKVRGLKGTVGAAWVNDDGTVTVILNNFVKLEQDGHLLITLFKCKDGERELELVDEPADASPQ